MNKAYAFRNMQKLVNGLFILYKYNQNHLISLPISMIEKKKRKRYTMEQVFLSRKETS